MTRMSIDSGLHCLALVAQFHQVAAEPAGLQHRFGQGAPENAVRDIVRAARRLGFRAKQVRAPALGKLSRVLPAIARARDGAFLVLAAVDEGESGTRR